MPGLKRTNLGAGDFKWLLHTHGIRDAVTSGVVDISAFTKATHYPDGYLPSGLFFNVANPLVIVPFTGGAGEKLAFLMGDHSTDGVEDPNVAFLFHGSIRTEFLPVKTNLPAAAPAGFYFTKGA